MKRKTLAFLLSAILAVQPASVVLAEDLLSSGNESVKTVQEAASLTDGSGNTPNLVGGGVLRKLTAHR